VNVHAPAADDARPGLHAVDAEALPASFDALQAAAWSPQAFGARLPALLGQCASLSACARTPWLAGMREVARRAWALPAGVRDAWTTLLAEWADWPLLLAVAGDPGEDDDRPEGVSRLVAIARFRSGDAATAMALCRRALLLRPDAAWAVELHRACRDWQAFLDRVPPIEDGTLRLEPLGHHHCADVAWQYWHPDIARLCCLPTFRDDEAWHRWLDECWGYGDQRLYAVLHRDWGFVGSVSLTMHDDLGFFYYWIGRDFQGQGLGPAAVRLLLADAFEHRGMRACYAKVFEDNAPSRRALARLGFEALDFRPAPPGDDELLYRLGPPQERWHSAEALRGLFARMGSDTRVAVPSPGALRDRWQA
jgi:RimJ/RimL family protein N-acetyltransferase